MVRKPFFFLVDLIGTEKESKPNKNMIYFCLYRYVKETFKRTLQNTKTTPLQAKQTPLKPAELSKIHVLLPSI